MVLLHWIADVVCALRSAWKYSSQNFHWNKHLIDSFKLQISIGSTLYKQKMRLHQSQTRKWNLHHIMSVSWCPFFQLANNSFNRLPESWIATSGNWLQFVVQEMCSLYIWVKITTLWELIKPSLAFGKMLVLEYGTWHLNKAILAPNSFILFNLFWA